MNQQTKHQLKQLLSALPPHRSGKPIAVITPVPGVPVNIAVVAGIPEHAREQQAVLDALKQALQENCHAPRLDYIPLTATATPSDIAETVGIATAFSFLHIQDSFIIALGAGAVTLFASHVMAVLEDRRRCHVFAHNVRSLMRALSTKQLRTYPTNPGDLRSPHQPGFLPAAIRSVNHHAWQRTGHRTRPAGHISQRTI